MNRNFEVCMQPIWDYMVLELPEDKKSRIVKPDNADPRKVGTLELIVLSTGPDCRNVQVGDRLVFNPEAAVLFSYEDKQYYLISERATGVVVGKLRRMEKCTNGRMPA